MAVCTVLGCSTVGGHKFPRRDQERLEKWLVAIRRDSFPFRLARHAVVCRKHFLPEDYALPKVSLLEKPRLQLKRDAVPSQFPWTNEDYIRKHNKRRRKKEKQLIKEEEDLKMELENKIKKELADTEYIEIEIDMKCPVSNSRYQDFPNDAEQKSDLDKFSINEGPPPLPGEEKICSPDIKQEPESDMYNEQEWWHGKLESLKTEVEDEPWGDAPADTGSFHTRLTVDGDNNGGELNESAPPSTSSSTPSTVAIDLPPIKLEHAIKSTTYKMSKGNVMLRPSEPKSCPTDPRFSDVIKLKNYQRVGQRLLFWEEHFVKRVMEAIRLKELEMKQAAEILGVSYAMLYGRYREAYGCINRPRTAGYLNPATSKSATDVLERLKRGDISMDMAAQALGCSARDLYVHYYNNIKPPQKEFGPMPIVIDPSLFTSGAMTSQTTPQLMASTQGIIVII